MVCFHCFLSRSVKYFNLSVFYLCRYYDKRGSLFGQCHGCLPCQDPWKGKGKNSLETVAADNPSAVEASGPSTLVDEGRKRKRREYANIAMTTHPPGGTERRPPPPSPIRLESSSPVGTTSLEAVAPAPEAPIAPLTLLWVIFNLNRVSKSVCHRQLKRFSPSSPKRSCFRPTLRFNVGDLWWLRLLPIYETRRLKRTLG